MGQHDDQGLRDWLVRIEAKIDKITRDGCSKANQHDDHEGRLRDIERQQAEARGKTIMAGTVVSILVSLVAVWIGKQFK